MHKTASARASGIGHVPLEPGAHHREPRSPQIAPLRADRRCAVSCGTFLRAEVAVELAKQRIAVTFGPVSQVLDEVFNLLASGLTKSFHTAEVGRIRLHQSGVELMLANDLAETIADFGATIPTVPVYWLSRQFASIGRCAS